MSKLTIYKASAGSGKTYKLTEEYLRLLFKNKTNYKKILGVTFTNKATEEMKVRIVAELHKLSTGNNSDFQQTFTHELKINNTQLQTIAQNLLNLILHNYSRFSISTIDSFFQNIIKAFAKEIGLFSGYTIELDQGPIIAEATDNMLAEVGDNKELRNWLTNFIFHKIQDGKSWNVNDNITKLSKELFTEEYQKNEKQLQEKISDNDFMKKYLSELNITIDNYKQTLKRIAIEGLKIISDHELDVSDFKGGSTGFMTLLSHYANENYKEPSTTCRKAVNTVENWHTKTSSQKQSIINAYNSGLGNKLTELVCFYDDNSKGYYTSLLILKNIYSLGLINDIASRTRNIVNEQNIFLLSDAAKLLQSIINNDDAPFIYEKTGQYFHHFMIDEFQDTSGFQWNNFKPLISNSLSENNKSLIVGDIKQSIYRWRNSDWKLLAEQADKDFNQFGTQHIELNINWRSKENVIKYNNTIFTISSEILQNIFNNSIPELHKEELAELQTKIQYAYQTVFQNTPDNKDNEGGIIYNHFLQNDDKAWENRSLEKVPEFIEELQEKGLKAKDITILVRRAKEGKLVADYLLEYKNSISAKQNINYDFISNESLYINSSKAVGFIINALRYLVAPEDSINKAQILYYYQNYCLKDSNLSLNDIFINVAKEDAFFNNHMPPDFINKIESLSKLSLYELIEKIIYYFELNSIQAETAYLIGLQNAIQQYSSQNTSDLHSFLEWWKENSDKHKLTISEDTDAIKIITIHKSKGLEFKAVIIPFCNWELDDFRHQEILWCQTEIQPFNKLNIIPVNYSSKLSKTIFYKEYYNEKLHNLIDNLNLLYVAFTRARDVLITLSPIVDISKGIKNIAGLLYKTINCQCTDTGLFNLSEYFNEEKNILAISSDELLPKNLIKLNQINIEDYNTNIETANIKVKLYSKDFFEPNEQGSDPIVKGIILHELFAGIKNQTEITGKIEAACISGKIDQADKDDLKTHINLALNNPMISEWFSDKYEVLNEKTILLPGNISKIPDRIMIKDNNIIVVDYKFGKEYNKYIAQVKEYCEILSKMGYKTKGYVWYLLSNKIIEV